MSNLNTQKYLSNIKNNLLIYIIFFAITIWYLKNIGGALSHDEVLYVNTAKSVYYGTDMYLWPDHPKFAQWFILIAYKLGNWTSESAKIPAILFALGTLFISYKIVSKIASKTIGIIAIILIFFLKLFSTIALAVIFDMTLTFLILILIYLLLQYQESTTNIKLIFLIGCISSALMVTKYYGIFFVLYPLGYIIYIKKENFKYFMYGFILSFLIIYSPYLYFDTENITNKIAVDKLNPNNLMRNNPLILMIMDILPYLPAVFYLFARSFGVVTMLTQTTPPLLTYTNYIIESGLFFLFGLGISILYCIYLVQKKQKNPILFISAYTIIPFILFSLKFGSYKYLLPLFVLFIIIILSILYKLWNNNSKSIVIGFFLINIIIGYNPVFGIAEKPDSKYDLAARNVLNYIDNSNLSSISILVSAPHVLEYYLNQNAKVEQLKTMDDKGFIRSNIINLTYLNKTTTLYLYSYEFNEGNKFINDPANFEILVMDNYQINSLNISDDQKIYYIKHIKYIG